MFKVLGELSNEDQKALLLELPQDILENLVIHPDGSVDTKQFLECMVQLSQRDETKHENELSLHEEIELMLNIYDSDRAADFNNKYLKTNN